MYWDGYIRKRLFEAAVGEFCIQGLSRPSEMGEVEGLRLASLRMDSSSNF
jgi:hypothetical protein